MWSCGSIPAGFVLIWHKRVLATAHKTREQQRGINMAYGRTIELFLVDGKPDGIVTAELSNWNGSAIKIPRTDIITCKRADITGVGVYFLFCNNDRGLDSVYIGEAENILDRLKQHIRDYDSDREKYYWSTAVAFLGRDLNKALIRYLENRFVETARQCKQYDVLTKNTFSNTVLKESQIAVMEEFIDNVKILINILGYRVFSEATHESFALDNLYCTGNGAQAIGYFSTGGFTVLKDSIISDHEADSFPMRVKGYHDLKRKLEANGIIVERKFTVDYEFNSPSAAAAVVLGRSANGKKEWNVNK